MGDEITAVASVMLTCSASKDICRFLIQHSTYSAEQINLHMDSCKEMLNGEKIRDFIQRFPHKGGVATLI